MDDIAKDSEITIKQRCASAQAVLDLYMADTKTDLEDVLCDLLADLQHWCDRNEMDFFLELDRAALHYEGEREGGEDEPDTEGRSSMSDDNNIMTRAERNPILRTHAEFKVCGELAALRELKEWLETKLRPLTAGGWCTHKVRVYDGMLEVELSTDDVRKAEDVHDVLTLIFKDRPGITELVHPYIRQYASWDFDLKDGVVVEDWQDTSNLYWVGGPGAYKADTTGMSYDTYQQAWFEDESYTPDTENAAAEGAEGETAG